MKTGIHRPSQICPAEYRHVCCYSLATTQDGWPIPSFNIDLVVQLQREHMFATTGPGRCTVCGASFIYGEVWVHEPTGEHIHVGWQCAHKYGLFADRAQFKQQRAVHVDQAIKRERRRHIMARVKQTLRQDPELRAALGVSHHITKDIRARFIQYGEVSEKQRDLLIKLAVPQAPEPTWINVPEGRQVVEGVVLSAKYQDDAYGSTYKMLVLVEGSYKVWGTVPALMEDRLVQMGDDQFKAWNDAREAHFNGLVAGGVEPSQALKQVAEQYPHCERPTLKGQRVRFTATLKAKELGFGFFSRPTGGELL